MTDENNHIKTFSAADIEKYHRGQLSPKEMHAIEKAALDDPFLADALEGYAVPGVDVTADLAELKRRLSEKKEETKVIPIHSGSSSFTWLRAAVMIVVLAGALLLSYQFFFNSTSSNSISQAKESNDKLAKAKEPVAAQKEVSAVTDTVLLDNTTSGPGADSYKTLANGTVASPSEKNNTNLETISITPGISTKNTNKDASDLRSLKKDEDAKVVITQNNPAKTTLTTPDDTKNEKEEVPAVGYNADADKKNMAVKEGGNSRDKITAKRKADTETEAAAVGRSQAPANTAVDNNQQGLYQNNTNSANIFRGQIKDANNTPLPFANVTNTRDNVGTYSDAKGNFVLVSPDSVMDVQVRSLGYENNRIRLRGNLPNNSITLQEDRSLSAKILDTVKRNYRTRDGNLALEEPEPADGWSSYDSYLANNKNDVPEAFDIKKNSGSDAVELSFEVNKNGEPVNIRVEKSLCDKCDKEAIRLVKEGPKWKRKAKKGKRTTVTVPFVKTD